MKSLIAERVYETLSGVLLDEYRVPGVDNAFSEGSTCAKLYSQILDAYARLCERLGADEEDADVEVIINSFDQITKILGLRMSDYGIKFGQP